MTAREHTTAPELVASRTAVVCCIVWITITGLAAGSNADRSSRADLTASSVETEYICVSLRALEKKIQANLANRAKLQQRYQQVGGISRIDGFITVNEPDDRDVILVGRKLTKRPTLHLDDLLVNMRCVGRGSCPYCSLDPLPKHIRKLNDVFRQSSGSQDDSDDLFKKVKDAIGPQQVVVGGVPKNSRHAHIMIDADYHMKKVSQGLLKLPNVKSSLDISREKAKQYIRNGQAIPPSRPSMSRFWFHVQHGRPTFQEADGIVWLDDCQVVILTEKQATTSSGELYDVKEDDPIATAFADNLSQEFSNLTTSVPVYADLENLFRLRALLLAMRHRQALSILITDFNAYLRKYQYLGETPMKPSLPGLANQEKFEHSTQTKLEHSIQTQTLILIWLTCGGVSMDMPVTNDSFHKDQKGWLSRFRTKALLARPSQDEAIWEVRASADLVINWPQRYVPQNPEALVSFRLVSTSWPSLGSSIWQCHPIWVGDYRREF